MCAEGFTRPDTHKAGAYGREDPPVPIPNTVVKLSYADNTWREAAREDKAVPAQHQDRKEFLS